MYMLEAPEMSTGQINSAKLFRISEYPVLFIEALLSDVEKQNGRAVIKAVAFTFEVLLIIQ